MISEALASHLQGGEGVEYSAGEIAERTLRPWNVCSLRLTPSLAPSRQRPLEETGCLPPNSEIGWTLTCAGTRTN